jgi:uncharacterized membrane protein YraQ (UPF0718 family)
VIPTGPDLIAMALQVGALLRTIGPFVLFGAAAAAAQAMLFKRVIGPWRGYGLIGPIATIPLGALPVIGAAFRSWLLSRTSSPSETPNEPPPTGALNRVVSYLDDLIFPFLVSAVIAAAVVVLVPADTLWPLFSPPEPWRFLLAPLIAGAIKPRGGTELPLVLAMLAKGLDPAGAVAAVAGAGYRHARSWPLAGLHIGAGAATGMIVWLISSL